MSRDVDLFVLGAGSGGVRAARIAAGYGARVMVAEENRPGGTCVLRGCVPKKLLMYASRFADMFHDAVGFGWDASTPAHDWPTLRDRVEAEVTRLSGLYDATLATAGARLVRERAVLDGPNAVRLANGDRVSAEHILIATGGHPLRRPTVPGVERAIVSDDVFHLPEMPGRFVIVGGGYIALEFASIFARLGSTVTVVHRGDEILRGFDKDLRPRLRAALERAGIVFRLESSLAAIEPGTECAHLVRLTDGEALPADAVLLATGRAPNTGGLGLEEAGVALGRSGEIPVDAGSTTRVPSIHAVGDVTDRVQLTPVAIREGHALADTLFGNKPWTVDHSLVPSAVFTTPEAASVGFAEDAPELRGRTLDIYEATFRPMLAILGGRDADRSFMKLVVDHVSQKVLGMHMLGPDAGEIVQAGAIALGMGATKHDFDRTIALHPSAAEEFVTMRNIARTVTG